MIRRNRSSGRLNSWLIALMSAPAVALALVFALPPSLFAEDEVDEDLLTIANIGDIMCHDPQLAAAWDASRGVYDFDQTFATVAAELSRADLTIGNLETTLPGDRRQFTGYPAFGSPDELAGAARRAGVDILTLANNHSVDKGRRGILRTLEVVQSLGFQHLGTYSSLDDWNKRRILWVEAKGLRLALLNYTYGTNGIRVPAGLVVNQIEDGRQIAEDLALARSQAPDAIIVLYHYGTEYLRQPDAYQQRWTNFAFEHGADIVLGGHPHVVQPYAVKSVQDRYGETRDRLVIYSTGNFVSNQQRRHTDGGVIFRFALEQDGDRARFRKVDYTPIWVLRDRQGGKLSYRILPTFEYLNNDRPLRLDAAAMQRMMLFHNDLQQHLAASREQLQSYELALTRRARAADTVVDGVALTGRSGIGCSVSGFLCPGF